MLVTPSPLVTEVREVQSRKAESPMLVTLSGMVIAVKLLQFSKAPLFNPVRTPYKIAA